MVGEFRGREFRPCHRAGALLSTGHVSNVSCSRNTVTVAVLLLQYRLLVSCSGTIRKRKPKRKSGACQALITGSQPGKS